MVPLFVLAQLGERPDWRVVARSWPRVLLPAVFGFVAYNYLLHTALQYTDAVNASPTSSCMVGGATLDRDR
ncbi:hypothetical protein ACFXA3_01875 [Streptomyces sp. NPDC059456]|uniref:hypothetical protein n=1 Tax=Streptomyces sp. NPDC059456 TaxID=3346838 RepID=UPI0036A0F956